MTDNQPESTPLGSRYYFVIRRLHSLAGLIPVGVFLCIHLTANASVLVPGEHGAEFQRSVDRIHLLGPLLIPVEILGIFIPILFHALLGFQIILSGASNAQQYRYGGNIRYTAQRITGVIAFVFLLYHVWQMHWLGAPLGGAKFDPHDATRTAAMTIQAAWWIAPIYTIGVLASVFHLANGIWTLLITWGITIKPQSQRTAGYVCAAFGIVVSLLGLGSLRGFKTFDVQEAAVHGAAVADVIEAPGP